MTNHMRFFEKEQEECATFTLEHFKPQWLVYCLEQRDVMEHEVGQIVEIASKHDINRQAITDCFWHFESAYRKSQECLEDNKSFLFEQSIQPYNSKDILHLTRTIQYIQKCINETSQYRNYIENYIYRHIMDEHLFQRYVVIIKMAIVNQDTQALQSYLIAAEELYNTKKDGLEKYNQSLKSYQKELGPENIVGGARLARELETTHSRLAFIDRWKEEIQKITRPEAMNELSNKNNRVSRP